MRQKEFFLDKFFYLTIAYLALAHAIFMAISFVTAIGGVGQYMIILYGFVLDLTLLIYKLPKYFHGVVTIFLFPAIFLGFWFFVTKKRTLQIIMGIHFFCAAIGIIYDEVMYVDRNTFLSKMSSLALALIISGLFWVFFFKIMKRNFDSDEKGVGLEAKIQKRVDD
jgi:hypothetical protein